MFGKYPDEMTSRVVDGRLPTFTSEEVAMLKGSYDFIGLNHYTSKYAIATDPSVPGTNWDNDK